MGACGVHDEEVLVTLERITTLSGSVIELNSKAEFCEGCFCEKIAVPSLNKLFRKKAMLNNNETYLYSMEGIPAVLLGAARCAD